MFSPNVLQWLHVTWVGGPSLTGCISVYTLYPWPCVAVTTSNAFSEPIDQDASVHCIYSWPELEVKTGCKQGLRDGWIPFLFSSLLPHIQTYSECDFLQCEKCGFSIFYCCDQQITNSLSGLVTLWLCDHLILWLILPHCCPPQRGYNE